MTNGSRTIIIIVAVIVVLGAAWFLTMRNRTGSSITPPQQVDDKTAAYRENCKDVRIPKGQELDISVDPEKGLATIGYADENGQQQEVVLYYKANDGFAGCSEDARRVLLQIQGNERPKS